MDEGWIEDAYLDSWDLSQLRSFAYLLQFKLNSNARLKISVTNEPLQAYLLYIFAICKVIISIIHKVFHKQFKIHFLLLFLV